LLEDDLSETGVKMGSLAISGSSGSTLSTFVGSCVALCLYDPVAKVGGLAHVMLPDSRGRGIPDGNEAKYADHALNTMLQRMTSMGAEKARIISKIAGGAKMFTNENSDDSLFNVGERNCSAIKRLLEQTNIPLAGELVGSHSGRWVKFDLATGSVKVSDRTGETII
jgi:chemotaxis protein CheD